jgi:hypothetical protein
MLRRDGYSNWADVAMANEGDLVAGLAHADNYLGRIVGRVQLEVLFGLFSVDLYERDIAGLAGCYHYYCPETGKGLNASVKAYLLTFLDWFFRVAFM